MGLFNKIKNMFKTDKNEEVVVEKKQEDSSFSEVSEKSDVVDENIKSEEKKSVKVYEKGLSKSRKGFVSRLADLTNKFSKITDEYFDELEEILIMADIGVNTVMDFIDKLKKRVKHENITDSEDLETELEKKILVILHC